MATKITRVLRRAELSFVGLGIALSILAATIIALVDGCTLLSRQPCRLPGIYAWAYMVYASIVAVFCFYSAVVGRIVAFRILFGLQGLSFASFALSTWALNWIDQPGAPKLLAAFRVCTALVFVFAFMRSQRKAKASV